MSFRLDARFVDGYRDKDPGFGFAPLGEITYLRTYSRLKDNGEKETWVDTVERVVNGCYNMQREHITQHNLGWSDKKAQRSAREMFDRMFHMKFLPPGRGLWAMGTSITKDRKMFAALNNCFAGNTEFFVDGKVGKLIDYVGKPIKVLDKNGMEREATVANFGKQRLNTVILRMGDRLKVVRATPDHRWILSNGVVTTNLRRGDVLWSAPPSTGLPFSPHEDYARGRLTGMSLMGEFDSQDLPLDSTSFAIKAGFLKGVVQMSDLVVTSDPEVVNWFEKYSGMCDVILIGMDHEMRDDGRVMYTLHLANNTSTVWHVDQILEKFEVEDVYCVMQQETRSFMLSQGVSTGNCGFVSTSSIEKDKAEPFCFMMDMMMLGVGIGSDTLGVGKTLVTSPLDDVDTFGISDDREGWVESVRRLINSYFIPNSRKVEFDYSKIRPKGAPIKCFGGTASGPEPLRELHEGIRKVLDKNVGSLITETTIADIFNMIGCCVVAGNVRRSAEIIFGPHDSKEFINLKNYDVNPERRAFGWASNNSIFAQVGMEYGDVADRVASNGEPGFAWLENMRAYSRMKDTEKDNKDFRVAGGNPCVSIDTKVMTSEGVAIVRDLIGKPFVAVVNGKEYPSTEKGFWKTGENKELLEIHLECGIRLKVTETHEIMLAEGTMKAARELKLGNRVQLSDNREYVWNQIPLVHTVGVIQGLLSNEDKKSHKFMELFQQVLLSFGIATCIEYHGDGVHELSMDNARAIDMSVMKSIAISGVPNFTPQIVKIEKLEKKEDVYDCTIPGIHLFSANGVVVSNCNEQSLESYELCCLVENFPFRCDDENDFNRTLKFAYMYAKTVTLGNTHWPQTNRVLLRNRRIGCSLSGIAQFLCKHGIEELRRWCESGYKTIQKYDGIYSNWLCIPRSIKTTSIKPSGTVALLADATPGMHYPLSRHIVRRIRLADTNVELLSLLKKGGYHIEPDSYSKGTMVVSIPLDGGKEMRYLPEVSMWEQLSLAAFLQKYWADNQVSATITFTPDEAPQIKHALAFFQYQLKGVSFLPQLDVKSKREVGCEDAEKRLFEHLEKLESEAKEDERRILTLSLSELRKSSATFSKKTPYEQMPYETITEEKYKQMKSTITPVKFQERVDSVSERYCDGDKCTL